MDKALARLGLVDSVVESIRSDPSLSLAEFFVFWDNVDATKFLVALINLLVDQGKKAALMMELERRQAGRGGRSGVRPSSSGNSGAAALAAGGNNAALSRLALQRLANTIRYLHLFGQVSGDMIFNALRRWDETATNAPASVVYRGGFLDRLRRDMFCRRPASSSPAGGGGSSSPPAEPRLDGWAEWQAEVQRRNTRDAFSRAQRTLPPALSEAEAAAAWLSEDGRQNRRDALARARPPLPVRADPRVFDDSLEHGMPLAWLDLPRNRGPERNADARYARRAAHVNAPPGHAAPPFAPASLPPPLASGGRPLPPPPRGMPPPPQGLVGSATASGLPPTPQGLPPPVRSLQGA